MKLSNETYDILQKVVRIFVPLVIFLTALGDIWGFAWMGAVVATVSALELFLGSVLDISNTNYKKELEKMEDV